MRMAAMVKDSHVEIFLGQKYQFCPPYIFPKRQILDPSKLKELEDDNFKLDENGIEFTIRVENKVGKGEIAPKRAISPFLIAFSKGFYCRHVKTRACLGKGF